MENINVNVKINETTEVKCTSCENNTFIQGVMFRKVSRFLTGQPKDGLIPFDIFICAKCGSPNEDFIPDALKNVYTDFEEINPPSAGNGE